MNKLLLCFLTLVFPMLAIAAEGDMSFAPPPGDYSVVFLGNIFGVVDGVLHGTGSQIMGVIFGVFNSAVLALGGIVIMYTLLVSTLNTAHEGQMLGQKWSSIWIPMRSTLGLALLIPKASGYCLMQIFVMWLVVQGVGAADKVWDAALGYLNRGGAIVQPQMGPNWKNYLKSADPIFNGAAYILSAQVCMEGVQAILQSQRQSYVDLKQKGLGPCTAKPHAVLTPMDAFCNTAVPDFVNSVNIVGTQNANLFEVKLPNFASANPYSILNGLCGTLTWNPLPMNLKGGSTDQQLTPNELKTASMSRAIALQQMYMDLATLAKIMVNNDPQLNSTVKQANASNYSAVARDQFGVAYLKSGQPCTEFSLACTGWGADAASGGKQSPPLFSGFEFHGAILDYNAIMLPTLNLMVQSLNQKNFNDHRAFIQGAKEQGWLMAGSYFFNIVRLTNPSEQNPDLVDTSPGLPLSYDASMLTKGFGENQACTKNVLCQWLSGNKAPAEAVVNLIDGSGLGDALRWDAITAQGLTTNHDAIAGPQSSTVYGFINNQGMVQLPGQPGMHPPEFIMKFNIQLKPYILKLPALAFPCGKVWYTCLGSLMGDIFYNIIFVGIFNFFLGTIGTVINTVVFAFLILPLRGMAMIFQQGVAYIQQPGVNPIVALASMGIYYINFASDLWLYLLNMAITSALIPVFGVFIFSILALVLPLLFAWMSTMVGIGFITSYYIPIMPYMIFTFGVIAWLIAVIEAMVAAPIVALGVTHPEGHDAFGKGEQALMILMNVFLRPAMMVIGYIAAIALSYVAVWIINTGFSNAISYIQGSGTSTGINNVTITDSNSGYVFPNQNGLFAPPDPNKKFLAQEEKNMSSNTGYTGWAGIYAFFFCMLMYTTMYLTAVQKAFTLITYLPDKVLRFIGGQPEGIGGESSQWTEEAKGQTKEAGQGTMKAAGQMDQQIGGGMMKGVQGLQSLSGPPPNIEASGD